MEKNLHAALQTAFAKLELVTREEFEVQQGVLARTRAKLEELEKQVAELETKVRWVAANGAKAPKNLSNRKVVIAKAKVDTVQHHGIRPFLRLASARTSHAKQRKIPNAQK